MNAHKISVARAVQTTMAATRVDVQTATNLNPMESRAEVRKEGTVLFNDALNTFYLLLYGVGHMVKNHSDSERGNILFNDALNTFYLRLYGIGYMVKDHSDREETRCSQMGYSFILAARVLLYALSPRQDNTYHGFCYTSRGALVGKRNSSVGPP